MPIPPDFPVNPTSRRITQITPHHGNLCSKCAHAYALLRWVHRVGSCVSQMVSDRPSEFGEFVVDYLFDQVAIHAEVLVDHDVT